MAEGLESGASVIPTHAALTYAAEGHGAGGEMNDGVVDGRRNLRTDPADTDV